jgi:HK97 gp10 family phage protein
VIREVAVVRSEKEPGSAQELRDIANSDEIQSELRKLARDIQKDARRLAPVRTGRLRRGIVVEEITDLDTGLEGFAVGWNNKAFYGWMVENGSEGKPARPHLVPAAIKNGAVVQGRKE